jgi:hypothetical protein
MWQCAACFKPLRVHSCYTAACGHGFHEACIENLKAPSGRVQCPECCDDDNDHSSSSDEGGPWRTFWATADGDSASQIAAAAEDDACPMPSAEWRRVVRLEQKSSELAQDLEQGRQALEAERKRLARSASLEAGLRRDLANLRSSLDSCRQRSLSAVVAHGAARCHAQLLKAEGAGEVVELLSSLRKAHGHALPELFAVQQLVLTRLQARRAARAHLRDPSPPSPPSPASPASPNPRPPLPLLLVSSRQHTPPASLNVVRRAYC